MKRQIRILAAVLCAGLCMAAPFPEKQAVVQARERSAGEKGSLQMRELVSRGNLVYRDGGEGAGIYAEDFFLLFGKLSMVSGESFDPAAYTHMHQWEYRNENGHAHTRHCAVCGIALTEPHKAEREEDCMISNGEKEFPGRRYQCICGFRWEREAAHILTFDMVNETCHRSRCLLDGTEYCPGYESAEEEHYAYYRTPDPSGTYYIKTCIDCGYQTEEEMEPDESAEEVSAEPDESTGEASAELDEIVKEETKQPEPEELPASEPSEMPEISVSGNDCAGNEGQNGAEEETQEIPDGEGGNL